MCHFSPLPRPPAPNHTLHRRGHWSVIAVTWGQTPRLHAPSFRGLLYLSGFIHRLLETYSPFVQLVSPPTVPLLRFPPCLLSFVGSIRALPLSCVSASVLSGPLHLGSTITKNLWLLVCLGVVLMLVLHWQNSPARTVPGGLERLLSDAIHSRFSLRDRRSIYTDK